MKRLNVRIANPSGKPTKGRSKKRSRRAHKRGRRAHEEKTMAKKKRGRARRAAKTKRRKLRRAKTSAPRRRKRHVRRANPRRVHRRRAKAHASPRRRRRRANPRHHFAPKKRHHRRRRRNPGGPLVDVAKIVGVGIIAGAVTATAAAYLGKAGTNKAGQYGVPIAAAAGGAALATVGKKPLLGAAIALGAIGSFAIPMLAIKLVSLISSSKPAPAMSGMGTMRPMLGPREAGMSAVHVNTMSAVHADNMGAVHSQIGSLADSPPWAAPNPFG